MSHLHSETPVHYHAGINQRLQKNIAFKMECYQPVGSFKIRGIGALCQQAAESGSQHLISSSGGNAGYAAAYAGKQLGIKTTVIVPETTSATAQARMREQDAEVIVCGAVWDEADTYARQLVVEMNATYIHPFDDPIVWQGHTSLIHEASQQMDKPDAVAVAVGGAGLLTGITQGLHAVGWDDVPIIAVETEGAASFAASHKAGEMVRLDNITSIAKTLGALQVTSAALAWSKKHEMISAIVTDKQAVDACLHFADDFRVVVEPSCGTALSLIYDNIHFLDQYDSVLMVVCGGASASIQQLLKWQEELL